MMVGGGSKSPYNGQIQATFMGVNLMIVFTIIVDIRTKLGRPL